MVVVSPLLTEGGRMGEAVSARTVLIIEYDGTDYHGFQLQKGAPTIQGDLEKAIHRLTGERRRVAASSRTDTGVHALGQVVSFRTDSALPLEAFVNGLNYYLPHAIAVRSAYRVPGEFNVRNRAVSREYRYTIWNRSTRSPLYARHSHRIPRSLDIAAMKTACRHLLGIHDFASFASGLEEDGRSTVREIYATDVKRDVDIVILTITGSAFVRHQVRSTAGALVAIGMGGMTPDDFLAILAAKKPGLAGPVLPSCGLCLIKVNYPQPFGDEI